LRYKKPYLVFDYQVQEVHHTTYIFEEDVEAGKRKVGRRLSGKVHSWTTNSIGNQLQSVETDV
jgi:hypothetical protein